MRRPGYVLARVVIPEQSLRDGERLRLVVVNGFIERLDTAGGARARCAGASTAWSQPARRPARPEARRDRAAPADRRRHLRGRAPLGALCRATRPAARCSSSRRTTSRSPASSGSTTRLSDELGTWTLATGVEINSALQARRDVLLPRLGLSRAATARAASAASSPAIRAPAPSRPARSCRSARTGSPSTSRRPAARRRPSRPTASRRAREFERLSFRAVLSWSSARGRSNVNAGLIFDAQSESAAPDAARRAAT